MVWVFDLEDVWNNENRIMISQSGKAYQWKWHWRMFDGFDPKREKNIQVFFQISNDNREEENLLKWSWKSDDGAYIAFNKRVSPIAFCNSFCNIKMKEKLLHYEGRSLWDILKQSTSEVVIVRNLNTNRRIKVKNRVEYKKQKPQKIVGYIGCKGAYDFYSDRRVIYGWDNSEWKLEWQS